MLYKNYKKKKTIFFVKNEYSSNKTIETDSKDNSEDIFEKKRKIGENDSDICFFIRNDLIDDFVIFVNKTNYKLESKIETSFETNSYLINKNPTLIEYATFYESIQILRYLILNKIEINKIYNSWKKSRFNSFLGRRKQKK